MKRTKNLLLIVFLIISISSNAQKIEGVYKVDDIEMTAADIGTTYSFDQDSTFRQTIHEHLGQKTISGGSYELQGNTLKLYYTELKATPPNPIKIMERERLNSSSDTSFSPMFSNLKVFNSEGEPQSGVHLVLQNKDKNPVMAFVSDSIGNFPQLNIYDNYIEDLQFSFPGHKEAYLKTDSLFNYRTEIEVRLNDSSQEYENTARTIVYHIKKRTKERIELIAINGDEKARLILMKAK